MNWGSMFLLYGVLGLALFGFSAIYVLTAWSTRIYVFVTLPFSIAWSIAAQPGGTTQDIIPSWLFVFSSGVLGAVYCWVTIRYARPNRQ